MRLPRQAPRTPYILTWGIFSDLKLFERSVPGGFLVVSQFD